MVDYRPYVCKFCGHREKHHYNQCSKCRRAGSLKMAL